MSRGISGRGFTRPPGCSVDVSAVSSICPSSAAGNLGRRGPGAGWGATGQQESSCHLLPQGQRTEKPSDPSALPAGSTSRRAGGGGAGTPSFPQDPPSAARPRRLATASGTSGFVGVLVSAPRVRPCPAAGRTRAAPSLPHGLGTRERPPPRQRGREGAV